MERAALQARLSEVDKLSAAQRLEASAVLAGFLSEEASVAAIAGGVGEDQTCSHCGAPGAVVHGKSGGMQRYLCRSCQRSFGMTTGAAVNSLHRKDLWLTFDECRTTGDTVAVSALAVSTAFRWRHRFLAGISTTTQRLKGIGFGHGPKRATPLHNDRTEPPESGAGKRQKAWSVRQAGASPGSQQTVSAVLPAVNARCLRAGQGCAEPAIRLPFWGPAMRCSTSPQVSAFDEFTKLRWVTVEDPSQNYPI